MFYFILALHLFLCLVLVTLVLLQQGKGASVGAVFGGSSNTLFGAAGANTVLTKVTTGVAVAFMVTSVILVRMYGTHVTARTGTNDALAGSALSGAVVEAPVAAPAEEKPAADTGAPAPVGADTAKSAEAAAVSSVAAAPAPQQEKPAGADAKAAEEKK